MLDYHIATLGQTKGYERADDPIVPDGFPQGVSVIAGVKGDDLEFRDILFDSATWRVDAAKKWLAENEMIVGSFADAPREIEWTATFKAADVSEIGDIVHVSGPVLVPEAYDGQGDIVSADVIRAGMRDFMVAFQQQIATLGDQHKTFGLEGVFLTENYQSKVAEPRGDTTFPAGTWFMEWRIEDAEIAQQVLSGERTGFSIGGKLWVEDLEE